MLPMPPHFAVRAQVLVLALVVVCGSGLDSRLLLLLRLLFDDYLHATTDNVPVATRD